MTCAPALSGGVTAGEVAEPAVSATGAVFLQKERGLEDVVFATLEYPDGRLAHIHVSWLDPHKTRRLTVVHVADLSLPAFLRRSNARIRRSSSRCCALLSDQPLGAAARIWKIPLRLNE